MSSYQRYKLTIEYDGRGFVGWQRQENLSSIQGWLEEAVYRFCGVRAVCTASGRTDAGVHALGQVVHVDVPVGYAEYTILHAINFHLRGVAEEYRWPNCPISVLNVSPVADNFHARFSSRQRGYIYKILNRPGQLTWQTGLVWHVPQALDIDLMHHAAQDLVGTHDFTSFRSQGCQAQSALKTLDKFTVMRQGDEVICSVEARSFLYHQVRNMVGTLVQIGRGKRPSDSIPTILAACNRSVAGPMAPADGLYFSFVVY